MVRGRIRAASWAAAPVGPAWAVAVGSLALCVASLVLHARTAGGLGASTDLHLADLWLAILGPIVGAALCGRMPGSRAGPVLLSTAAIAVGAVAGAYAVWSAEQGPALGAGVAAWLATWVWVPFFVPPLMLAALVAPDGAGRHSWFLGLATVDLAAIAVLSAVAPGPAGQFRGVSNPWGIAGAPWLATASGVLIGITAIVLVPGALVLCLVRWRRAVGDGRWQAGLLAGGQAAFTAGLLAPVQVQPWSDVLVAVGQTALLTTAALVAYLRGVTSAVRAEREGLARAREEERRRLHRDLHDGVAPELSGLALQLDALAAEASGAGTGDRIGEVGDRLRSAVGEIRRVVDDLRPAGLEALGLVEALRAHARVFSTRALTCTVEADGVSGLPTAVEVAAYRIVTEAIANAARHSGASHVVVGLRTEGAVLHVAVADDGEWLRPTGAAPGSGIGIPSMRARAVDVGGSFDLGTGVDGTVVSARIPVHP